MVPVRAYGGASGRGSRYGDCRRRIGVGRGVENSRRSLEKAAIPHLKTRAAANRSFMGNLANQACCSTNPEVVRRGRNVKRASENNWLTDTLVSAASPLNVLAHQSAVVIAEWLC